jgi:hypothetical protein
VYPFSTEQVRTIVVPASGKAAADEREGRSTARESSSKGKRRKQKQKSLAGTGSAEERGIDGGDRRFPYTHIMIDF